MLHKSPELDAALIAPFAADMGNVRDVQRASRALTLQENRLDILVNNAAVVSTPFRKNSDGIAVSFATNHLGTFVLTKMLTPLLIETGRAHAEPPRIINVASTSHHAVPQGTTFSSLEDFNNSFGNLGSFLSKFLRYGYSKLANILHLKELQRRLDGNGANVLAMSVHPTTGVTNAMIRHQGGAGGEPVRLEPSPLDGATTILYAAAHPEPEQDRIKFAGSFIMPFGCVNKPSEDAQNPDLARQLWETTESVLGNIMIQGES
ncbi:hypothetical protein FDECE_2893 [Fusarium decemcellulare]|nr:hypothetical protein FDECE_2893 [Fusarium decemcellulare]